MPGKFRAIVFDVDGVLTEIDSVWRFIHGHLNTLQKARENAKLFYSGKISYEEWARLDVELWKGVSRRRIISIVEKIPVKEGLAELISFLKKRKLKVFAISAGLDLVEMPLRRHASFDEFVANRLLFDNDVVSGEVEVYVTVENKGEVLGELCARHGIDLCETIAVGDSEVDISMFEVAGLSIAFNPKDLRIAMHADVAVYGDLLKMLRLFKKIL
ncbi:MAG: hypothetical protein DRJ51_03770 [Thermoprotei archaeon]|nr:MAG: hypothetical protein DRJ51_03770 [Thermoprotei archaeon]